MSAGTSMYPTQCRFESLERVKPIQLLPQNARSTRLGACGPLTGRLKLEAKEHRWLEYSASLSAPGRRGGATAIPSLEKDIWIIKLLQNGDNGGLCPFVWQDFTVFMRGNMAGSCQWLKLLKMLSLRGKWRVKNGRFRPFYLGIFARPCRNA